MRGSAFEFVRRIPDPHSYDLVFTSSLIDISALIGLWHGSRLVKMCGNSSSGRSKAITLPTVQPPVLLYMHENQVAYPLAPGEKRDFHYGLTDAANCLSAQHVLFNSKTHRDEFIRLLPDFLSRFPDFEPSWTTDLIRGKSSVVYPGVDAPPTSLHEEPLAPCSGRAQQEQAEEKAGTQAQLILWNHRWEHDKGPEDFFRVLFRLADEGVPFRLALLGEHFSKVPSVFREAEERLAGRIVHSGYIDSRAAYLTMLSRADIVISTARQENFGISVVEAIRAGCRPLLPSRLSYPELIPDDFHGEVLYRDAGDLEEKLRRLLNDPRRIPLPSLSGHMKRFDWPRRIPEFDRLIEETILCYAGEE